TRELSAAELAELLRGAGLRLRRLAGVHHGPRLRELDARHGGAPVGAPPARAMKKMEDAGLWAPAAVAGRPPGAPRTCVSRVRGRLRAPCHRPRREPRPDRRVGP